MERRRIPIRERRGSHRVPVEIVAAPSGLSLSGVPRILTFRFRSRLVVCKPLWNDAGELVVMTFQCPACWGLVSVGGQQGGIDVARDTGRISVPGCVRCEPGCGLHLHIDDGRSTTWPAMFACVREACSW